MNKRQFKKKLKHMTDTEVFEAFIYEETTMKKMLTEKEFNKRFSSLIDEWNSLDSAPIYFTDRPL